MQAALADWRVGPDVLGGLGRQPPPGPGCVRPAGRRAGRRRRGRRQVSQLLAPVAAALPDGATVLSPDVEFTSQPLPVAGAGRPGRTGRTVPLGRLAERDRRGHRRGRVQPGPVRHRRGRRYAGDRRRGPGGRRARRGRRHPGVRLAAVRRDPRRRGRRRGVQVADVAARHRRSPTWRPAMRERMRPVAAGWYAGEDPHESVLRAAAAAGQATRAGSTSRRPGSAGSAPRPRWSWSRRSAWRAIHAHDVALANRFLTGLGRRPATARSSPSTCRAPRSGSAAAGVRAAVRAGRVRASFHVYSSERDVDLAPRRPDRLMAGLARPRAGAGGSTSRRPADPLAPGFSGRHGQPGRARRRGGAPRRRTARRRELYPPAGCPGASARLRISSTPR